MKNVSVVRGENLALDRVSLRVDVGEHVCILGPNGCGKSTLIRTITRENYPLAREDASMSILGQSLWNVSELRNLLGIVSPDLLAACTSDATGLDVVLSGFFSSTRIFPHHAPQAEQLRRAEVALERLGITHLAKQTGGGDVVRRSETDIDRAGAGARAEDTAVRRAEQCFGHCGASGFARHDERVGAERAGDSAGDTPRVRDYSGDRARSAAAARKSARRWTEGEGSSRARN